MSLKILAGSLKGKALVSPATDAVRPTTSMNRAAVFNSLAAHCQLTDATVWDVCCGSGALGLEALSRGAAQLVAIDTNTKLTRQNVASCGVAARAQIITADATTVATANLPAPAVVFIDPPYGQDLPRRLLAHLAAAPQTAGAIWCVELEAGASPALLSFAAPGRPLRQLGHVRHGAGQVVILA